MAADFPAQGKRLDNGAEQHLDQACAGGIHRHRHQKAHIGIPKQLRENALAQNAHSAKNMGCNYAGLVANALGIPAGQKVHQDLQTEIVRNQKPKLSQSQAILLLKNDKQQWGQIANDRLRGCAQVAGAQGSFVSGVHPYPPKASRASLNAP